MCPCAGIGPVPATWKHLSIHPVRTHIAKSWGVGVMPTPVHIFAHIDTIIYAPHDSGMSEVTRGPYNQARNKTCMFFFFFFFYAFFFLPLCLSRTHCTASQWCDHRCFALHMSTEQDRRTQHFCTGISTCTSRVTPEHPALPWKACERQLKEE